MSPPTHLDQDGVGDYLLSRGICRPPFTNVETLAGGVSNIVVRLRTDESRIVVKQSLETLAVADEWTAPTQRAITEARVMTLLGPLTPGHVPTVIDQDEEQHTIVMSSAPPGWTDWKTELMSGTVDQGVARTLGGLLATWHQQTRHPSALLGPDFDEYEAFEALRLDPYFRTSAARAPEVANELLSVVSDMAARRSCLVHGDFSPKNVLVSPGSRLPGRDGAEAVALWVIDFEVAHRGDPAFDVAFMCTHLLMKSYAMPNILGELDAARDAFVSAYTDSPRVRRGMERGPAAPAPVPNPGLDWSHVSRIVGSLLIARVKGKSPADYLDEPARRHVLALGASLLREPTSNAKDITQRRDEHTG